MPLKSFGRNGCTSAAEAHLQGHSKVLPIDLSRIQGCMSHLLWPVCECTDKSQMLMLCGVVITFGISFRARARKGLSALVPRNICALRPACF